VKNAVEIAADKTADSTHTHTHIAMHTSEQVYLKYGTAMRNCSNHSISLE